jgi:hypothetical protein
LGGLDAVAEPDPANSVTLAIVVLFVLPGVAWRCVAFHASKQHEKAASSVFGMQLDELHFNALAG